MPPHVLGTTSLEVTGDPLTIPAVKSTSRSRRAGLRREGDDRGGPGPPADVGDEEVDGSGSARHAVPRPDAAGLVAAGCAGLLVVALDRMVVAWNQPLALVVRRDQLRREHALAEERRTVEEERGRVARELHDVVAHHVSAVAVQAGATRLLHEPAATVDAVGHAPGGGPGRAGPARRPRGTRPGGRRVRAARSGRGAGITVPVTDAGPVPGHRPPTVGSGLGLVGMRGRVDLLGGSLETGPHGVGWRVRAILPRPHA